MRKIYAPLGLMMAMLLMAAGTIDLNDLFNYQGLTSPTYILKDNTPSSNYITNEGATLGRVCFMTKSYQPITPFPVPLATNKNLPLAIPAWQVLA